MPLSKVFTLFDKYFRRGKPTTLYFNFFLRDIGVSLVGIFTPLYVLSLAKNPVWVLGYYLLIEGSLLILLLPLAPIVYFLHFRGSVFLSSLFLILNFSCLIFAKNNLLFLIPAALFSALVVIFYWIPYHLIFAEEGAEGGYEEDVGAQAVVGKLSSAFTLVLGGILISQTGFGSAYGAAIFLIFLSTLPLFFAPHHKKYRAPSSRKVFDGLKKKESRPTFLTFFGEGIESIARGVCWPLFLFPILDSYQSFGELIGAANFLSLIILILVLKFASQRVNKKLIFWSGVGIAFLWLLKGLTRNPMTLFVLEALYTATWLFFTLPFSAKMYGWCWGDPHPFEFVLRRELTLYGGRLFALLLLLPLFYFETPWIVKFLLGTFGMILAVYPLRE